MKDNSFVGERIIHAQMIAMGYKFAILIDGEIGHIIGGQPRFWVEGGGKRVRTEADVMRDATRVNDGALAIWKRLVKGEAGETIGKSDHGCRQETAGRAGGIETMPLRDQAPHEEHDQ